MVPTGTQEHGRRYPHAGGAPDVNAKQQSTLIRHGALVFLLGMAAGFPLAFELLGRLELWPVPGSVAFDMPGDVRGWRMAHMEGILNGMLLILIAAVGGKLVLSDKHAGRLVIAMLVTAYGNIAASWIGPLSETRGLSFAGMSWSSVVYLLFVAAIFAVVYGMWLVYVGARDSRDG